VMIGLQANELSTILAEPDEDHQFYHDTCECAACLSANCLCSSTPLSRSDITGCSFSSGGARGQ
jgi:hypothetical protein